MKVMPIRYVRDVEASVAFYRALGLEVGSVSRPGGWAELASDAGVAAVHAADDANAGTCELAFEADEALEAVAERIRAAGFTPGDIVDESFGRSMQVVDPDGVVVQINEHDRDLYTLLTATAEVWDAGPPGGLAPNSVGSRQACGAWSSAAPCRCT